MSKTIELSRGEIATVDDEDYEYLSQWKWSFNGKYAFRNPMTNGKQQPTYMHRIIAKTPEGMVTDHINRDRLDNRKENLRAISQSENCLNKSIRSDNKSGFIGVRKNGEKFTARVCKKIGSKTKEIYLGTFNTALEAAKAYDEQVVKVHGKLAATNGTRIEGWTIK
jgi:hypothetical protein